jgi:hypothetical protein
VLDYIVAAHPFMILQLIRERDSARHALHFLRHKIAGRDRVFQEAGGMAGIYLARATMGADQVPMDRAVTVVRAVVADLIDRNGLRQAWEEIDAGIRREIVESWEKIVRDQIAEVGEVPEVPEEQPPGDAGDPAGGAATTHPPIASYALGQSVIFHTGRGDCWHPGIVTRLEGGLRPDGSAWHTIFVSSTRDLPSGEWEHAGAYRLEDRDDARVSPVMEGAV